MTVTDRIDLFGLTYTLSPADQFPGLQSKMRVVLRVEVEAVKFLKEEPHRLDALLKRCKSITDTLATMRKYVPAPKIQYKWCHVLIQQRGRSNRVSLSLSAGSRRERKHLSSLASGHWRWLHLLSEGNLDLLHVRLTVHQNLLFIYKPC